MPTPPNATRADIIALLKDGHSNARIVRELRVDKHRVARIRAEHGLPNFVPTEQTRTLEEKWASLAQPVDGAHMQWTGEHVGAARTPVMRYKGKCYSPAGIAFRIKHGREPEGYVLAECGVQHCVAPDHVNDETGRQQARRELRAQAGLGDLPQTCAYGHDQAEHGKLETDGRAYCGMCKTLDKRAQRNPQMPRRQRTRLRPASLEDVFRTHIEPLDGGHIRWVGPMAMQQTPAVRMDGRMQSAFRVAFRLHHGREPEGFALPVCGVPLCVAGAHLEDRPMRQQSRRLYAAIFGEAS